MHNLGTVFRFEVVRTLKKKSFWIAALAFPIAISAIFAIIYLSNKTTDEAANNTKNQQFSLAVTDESGIIKPGVLKQFKATAVTDKQANIDNVTNGQLDAYFYYPKDLSKDRVEVYSKDVGLFNNGRYQGVSEAILQASIAGTVSPTTTAILKNEVKYNSVSYKDGQQYDGFKQLIAPGIFLVLFYILMAFFGNQMLTSTTEEKENRVIEMILTTIEARTLVIGKILSLIVLAGVQIVTILVPIVAAYLLFGSKLDLPNIDLTNIPLDGVRIGIGALIFVASFMLFTGLLVAIGAATPTAKEAGGFFGIVMTLIFGPLYAVTLFVSAPDSTLVRFLSLFPFTAPIPLMLRNAVGNLTPWETITGIVLLSVSAVIVLAIAVRLFRFGALEYSRRLSVREIFSRRT